MVNPPRDLYLDHIGLEELAGDGVAVEDVEGEPPAGLERTSYPDHHLGVFLVAEVAEVGEEQQDQVEGGLEIEPTHIPWR